jgi:hypothetical protein
MAENMRSQRTKLTLKDLGTPALVAAMSPEDLGKSGGKYIMGYLTGKASGFVVRAKEKPEPGEKPEYEGLAGIFVMVPSDPNKEELESGVLFIPDAFHNLIASQLREVQASSPDKGGVVEFVFEVASIAAKNPAGYSWEFKPAIPFKGKHLLDDTLAVVRKLQADKMKQLPAPAKK